MTLLIKYERKLDLSLQDTPPIFETTPNYCLTYVLVYCPVKKCITNISNFQLMSTVFQQFSTMSGVGLPTFTEAN